MSRIINVNTFNLLHSCHYSHPPITMKVTTYIHLSLHSHINVNNPAQKHIRILEILKNISSLRHTIKTPHCPELLVSPLVSPSPKQNKDQLSHLPEIIFTPSVHNNLLPDTNILLSESNLLLHMLRGYTNTNPHINNSMRSKSRTDTSGNIFLILHPIRLLTPSNSNTRPEIPDKNSSIPNPQNIRGPRGATVHHRSMMGDNRNSLPSKDASIWFPPMVTKGSCRSPSSRLYDISSHTPKARRIWTNTSSLFLPRRRYTKECSPHNMLLRLPNNQNNLSTTDGPKGSDSLLLSGTYETSRRGRYTEYPMKN